MLHLRFYYEYFALTSCSFICLFLLTNGKTFQSFHNKWKDFSGVGNCKQLTKEQNKKTQTANRIKTFVKKKRNKIKLIKEKFGEKE